MYAAVVRLILAALTSGRSRLRWVILTASTFNELTIYTVAVYRSAAHTVSVTHLGSVTPAILVDAIAVGIIAGISIATVEEKRDRSRRFRANTADATVVGPPW